MSHARAHAEPAETEAPVHPQAAALNQTLAEYSPEILAMLSTLGRGLYYPKQGLLLQAEEAAQTRYNATVGIALDDTGEPLHYQALGDMLKLELKRCVPYASSFGLRALREFWHKQLQIKNPDLSDAIRNEHTTLSLPVVTAGITHGLWLAFQMFLEPDDELLLPQLFYPNYRLIAQGPQAKLKYYNMFIEKDSCLDLGAIRNELQSEGKQKIFLFNFPHNPTGYSPRKSEIGKLQEIFYHSAAAGKQCIVLFDDAYWGLTYEEEVERQSLFSFFASLHRNILAIKLDGATKEDFSWGFRIGFISFASPALHPKSAQVLEEKVGAAIRMSVSNCSRLSQELLLEIYHQEGTAEEREKLQSILALRYQKVKETIVKNPDWREFLQPLPFNSGYFMTFHLKSSHYTADELRRYILREYDIGLIAIQESYIRFAFSAVPEKDIPYILQSLYLACKELGQIKQK